MRFSFIMLVTALLLSPVAFADDALQLDLMSKPFNPQKDAVLNAINTSPKYSEITPTDRANVESALLTISATLTVNKSIALLDDHSLEKIKFSQEAVNKLLEKAFRDSKMVCTKEVAIGSNMLKRLCKTAAARKRDSDFARDNKLKVSK